jgi:hypothetical protein
MPTNETVPVPQLAPGVIVAPHPTTTHDLHVKGVPLDVWRHARHNALLSNLSFKDYVIRTLAVSTPITSNPTGQSVAE